MGNVKTLIILKKAQARKPFGLRACATVSDLPWVHFVSLLEFTLGWTFMVDDIGLDLHFRQCRK